MESLRQPAHELLADLLDADNRYICRFAVGRPQLCAAARSRSPLQYLKDARSTIEAMANGSVRAYGTESPPLYRPQQPSPHNFRMYDDANTQGYSSLHPTQAIVDPISHAQSPYTAPSFFARIDARIQALEKQSIHADGFSRKLVDDAQVSIKNIRQTLSTLDNTVAQHANRITEQEDRLGSSTEAWDMMNERMDNLVTESGRQLTEALLQPMVASMKDILSEVSTYAHEKNAHRITIMALKLCTRVAMVLRGKQMQERCPDRQSWAQARHLPPTQRPISIKRLRHR